MSPLKFISEYNYSENKIGGDSESVSNSESVSVTDDILDIDKIVKNKDNSRICILNFGIGNKIFIIANIINQYKNYDIYFVEQTSIHQNKNSEKKLKYIFPEIKNSKNPKIISFKEFDILKERGVEKIFYTTDIWFDITGFIQQKEFLQKYLKMNDNILTNKYDFENGIFVHIRYGDKFRINYDILRKNNHEYFFTLLNASYYIDNINRFLREKKSNVYIFTDSFDMVKCLFKNKISNIENIIYTNADVYETLYCFIHCKRLIISESTLSISGIYLNKLLNQ